MVGNYQYRSCLGHIGRCRICRFRSSFALNAEVASKTIPPAVRAPFDAHDRPVLSQEAWAGHVGIEAGSMNSLGFRLMLIPPGEKSF